MLGVALLALLLVVAGVLGFLALPVDVRFTLAGGPELDGWKASVRIEWLGGRIGRDLEPGSRKRDRPKKERARPSLEQLRLLGEEPFRTRAKLAWLRGRPYAEIERLGGDLRVGLGDPADTGTAFGLLHPLTLGLRRLPRVDLVIAPDFEVAGVSGEAQGALRLVPLGLLAHGLAFVLSPEAIGTYRRFRSLGR